MLDLSIKLPCSVCGGNSSYVLALKKDKGFDYFCNEHWGKGDKKTLIDEVNYAIKKRQGRII